MIIPAGCLNQYSRYLRATMQAVTSQFKFLPPPAREVTEKIVTEPIAKYYVNYSLCMRHPKRSLRAISGPPPSTKMQIRFAHSDIKVPDFCEYRREAVKRARLYSKESLDNRRCFTYGMAAGCGIMSMYVTKTIVDELVMVMAPSADVLAMAKIEVNLDDIPEGKNATFKWRGKPLFVKHRTGSEIENMRNTDWKVLRDPEPDEDRVKRAEWLVVIGVCTHLGCVPISGAGDFPGGFYCPCHGSHFDAAGRCRKGPAPTNLEIPEYIFPTQSTLLVG